MENYNIWECNSVLGTFEVEKVFSIPVAGSGEFLAVKTEPSPSMGVLWNCRLVHVPSQEEIEIFGLTLISTVLDFHSFGRLPVITYITLRTYN